MIKQRLQCREKSAELWYRVSLCDRDEPQDDRQCGCSCDSLTGVERESWQITKNNSAIAKLGPYVTPEIQYVRRAPFLGEHFLRSAIEQ